MTTMDLERNIVLNKNQIWCFDLDGTLVDQRNRYQSVHNELVSRMGGVPTQDHSKKRRSGISEMQLFEDSYSDFTQVNKLNFVRDKMLEEKAYLSMDTIFPGVFPLLRYLRENKNVIWIITHRANEMSLIDQLRNSGLDKLVDGWNYTKENQDTSSDEYHLEERGASKAKAEILERFKRKYSPIMVGDSPTDIQAAHMANVESAAIDTGFFKQQRLAHEKPTYMYESISKLLEDIKK